MYTIVIHIVGFRHGAGVSLISSLGIHINVLHHILLWLFEIVRRLSIAESEEEEAIAAHLFN